MRIVSKYKIEKDSDLLFAKIDIANFLRRKNYYVDFFTFAVMELGTNILKYAEKGEIWLIEENSDFLLCALDRGEGIKDLNWAKKKGTSSLKNSLGLGLYQLSRNNMFDLLIYTSNDKNIHGSIFLLKPRHLNNSYVYLINNYMDMKLGGDFFEKKGRFFLIGDANGHGIKANKTAKFVKRFFMQNRLSCVVMDMIFEKINNELKSNSLRGCVLCVVEIVPGKISVCGVGNIGIYYKKDKEIKYLTQKEGILGEVYSKMSRYEILFDKNITFLAFSDGIDEKVLYNIIKRCDDGYLLAVSAVFFSKRMDDKIVFVYKE